MTIPAVKQRRILHTCFVLVAVLVLAVVAASLEVWNPGLNLKPSNAPPMQLASSVSVDSANAESAPTLLHNARVGDLNAGDLHSATLVRSRMRHIVECWTRSGTWILAQPHDYNARHVRSAYEWSPDSEDGCRESPFLPFNRTAFCSILRGRTIHVVGDSTSYDFHAALQRLGRADGLFGAKQSGEDVVLHAGAATCGGGPWNASRVPYFGSNLLHSRASQPGQEQHERPLSWYMRLAAQAGLAPDIFVLNRGMHYRDDNAVLGEIAGALSHISSAAPAALVFWRATPPPHPDCGAYNAPLASPLPTAALQRDGPTQYHWPEVVAQARRIRAMLARDWPGVTFLDVSTMMALRPDSHGEPIRDGEVRRAPGGGAAADCVHYRRLEEMDEWVRLLYNALRLLG